MEISEASSLQKEIHGLVASHFRVVGGNRPRSKRRSTIGSGSTKDGLLLERQSGLVVDDGSTGNTKYRGPGQITGETDVGTSAEYGE